jgi:serine/threonine-protein kinase RsbW
MNRVSYTLDSTLESVNKVEQTALQIATKAGFDQDSVDSIGLAVREAAVNAVLHGNQYDPNKKVNVSYEMQGDSFIIKVADQGKGLKEDNLPDPLAPENLMKQSGRGIFLIRSFMDEVKIRELEPGTELTMIKHLKPEPNSERHSENKSENGRVRGQEEP